MGATKTNGGPAFPVPLAIESHGTLYIATEGMTLRDWFAGQALVGLCASGETDDYSYEEFAQESYECADAMLKAREDGQ